MCADAVLPVRRSAGVSWCIPVSVDAILPVRRSAGVSWCITVCVDAILPVWRSAGVSWCIPVCVDAVLWRCASTFVIFLYLLDEQTSLLVLVPAGVGTVIEVNIHYSLIVIIVCCLVYCIMIPQLCTEWLSSWSRELKSVWSSPVMSLGLVTGFAQF